MDDFMERILAGETDQEKKKAYSWLKQVNISLEYGMKDRLVPEHVPSELVPIWEMIKEKATDEFKNKRTTTRTQTTGYPTNTASASSDEETLGHIGQDAIVQQLGKQPATEGVSNKRAIVPVSPLATGGNSSVPLVSRVLPSNRMVARDGEHANSSSRPIKSGVASRNHIVPRSMENNGAEFAENSEYDLPNTKSQEAPADNSRNFRNQGFQRQQQNHGHNVSSNRAPAVHASIDGDDLIEDVPLHTGRATRVATGASRLVRDPVPMRTENESFSIRGRASGTDQRPPNLVPNRASPSIASDDTSPIPKLNRNFTEKDWRGDKRARQEAGEELTENAARRRYFYLTDKYGIDKEMANLLKYLDGSVEELAERYATEKDEPGMNRDKLMDRYLAESGGDLIYGRDSIARKRHHR